MHVMTRFPTRATLFSCYTQLATLYGATPFEPACLARYCVNTRSEISLLSSTIAFHTLGTYYPSQVRLNSRRNAADFFFTLPFALLLVHDCLLNFFFLVFAVPCKPVRVLFLFPASRRTARWHCLAFRTGAKCCCCYAHPTLRARCTLSLESAAVTFPMTLRALHLSVSKLVRPPDPCHDKFLRKFAYVPLAWVHYRVVLFL